MTILASLNIDIEKIINNNTIHATVDILGCNHQSKLHLLRTILNDPGSLERSQSKTIDTYVNNKKLHFDFFPDMINSLKI